MHGIIVEVRVDVSREEEARRMLREMVVPRAKAHPGFAAGYWLRAVQGDMLRSIQVFESEDAAQSAAGRIRSEGPLPGAPVTLESVDVYEVLAQA
jgi:hypothetical protein